MKTDITTTSITDSCSLTDSTKLASLLALAAGAIAMPQEGNADIIFTDLSSNPEQVGFLGGGASYMLELPGTVKFGFLRQQRTETVTFPITTYVYYRTVIAYDMFGDVPAQIQEGPGGFAAPLDSGQPWNQGLPLTYTVAMGVANSVGRSPTSDYDRKFLAFTFVDSTAGDAIRYGWIEVSLSIVNVNPTGTSGGPNVTIFGYGWDNTGAQPTMGQKSAVPEPSSAALLVIGAMALGAPGLRRWRQSRNAGNS